jgi:transcriptional regulator with XRE-family HTH domain
VSPRTRKGSRATGRAGPTLTRILPNDLSCPLMTPLGEFLKARRALVRPQDAGAARYRRRRVPGLRREELAALACISPDYYLRLEQGRNSHPSLQVLDGLARALQLDSDAATYLHGIAYPEVARRLSRPPEAASPLIEAAIERWPDTPALVLSRYLDVLACNRLASALTSLYRPGVNLIRATFLDPEARRLCPDWERVAAQASARLRALAGPDTDDPRLTQLVQDLQAESVAFARLWARHDVVLSNFPVHTFNHQVFGMLELHADWLIISGTEDKVLVYHAAPGSVSEQALRRIRVTLESASSRVVTGYAE